ncbi:MAG: acyl carrier protein [Acidobacteriota bacterium]
MQDVSEQLIRNDLVDILCKLASLEAQQIRSEDRLREDLGLDCLQSMELLSRLCDRYPIHIEVEDIVDVQTVGDVVKLLFEVVSSGGKQ